MHFTDHRLPHLLWIAFWFFCTLQSYWKMKRKRERERERERVYVLLGAGLADCRQPKKIEACFRV